MKKFIVSNHDLSCGVVVIALLSIMLCSVEYIVRALGITQGMIEDSPEIQGAIVGLLLLGVGLIFVVWVYLADYLMTKYEEMEDEQDKVELN